MFNRLESSIEGACRRLAEDRGCELIKFTRRVGDPDRILMLPGPPNRRTKGSGGRVVLLEFKRPGRGLEIIQQHRAKEWRAMGFRVGRIDSVAQFSNLLDDLLA